MPTITFKVSPDEALRLRAAARGARLTVSEFVRKKVRGAPRKKKSPLLKRCPLTGVEIFHGTPDMIPLTAETVREMLADFP
jgi:hypothetical protein